MPRSLQLPIIAGGKLLTQPSVGLENVGAQDFTELLNLYRDMDKLARMPGWVKFRPDSGASVDSQYLFDGSATLLRLAELVRGDGTRVIVGASQSLIKYYDTATDAWVQIGSGFSASGVPWQCVPIAGYLIFNNAVNLPQWWAIGESAVQPVHELREAGIASVGRIDAYNGFLFVGDVVEIIGGPMGHGALWLNGYGSYTSSSTTTKNADFTITSADHRVRFDVTTGASTITATLPSLGVTNWGFYCFLKKADAGAGSVVTSPTLTGERITLSTQNDLALLFWNGTAWVAKKFPAGSVPATDPYGIIDSSLGITQSIPDEQAWSELGGPINWAPLVTGFLSAASTSVILPFKPYNWTAKQTRVAVVRGGTDGGTLGGQTLYPDGVMITAFAAFSAATGGVAATLEVTTDTSISYPRLVDVTRWSDVSTFVGKQRMGNGRRITAMLELDSVQIVYHEDGAWLNRYTANAKKPFALRFKYAGKAVPRSGDCVVTINNSFHLFPSIDGSFIRFDGLSDPEVHQMCEEAKDVFFTGLGATDRIWAVDNPALNAAWFCRPGKVFVYRYQKGSEGPSALDATINAAVFARQPGGSNNWFVLGISNAVYQFAMVNGSISSWLRDGSAPSIPARVTSGLNSFRDQIHEKTLHSITPILSSVSPADTEMTVMVRGTHNPNATISDLMDSAASIPDPDGNNFVPTFYQAIYFQDVITLTDTRDINWVLSARLFEFEVVGGVQITRSGAN